MLGTLVMAAIGEADYDVVTCTTISGASYLAAGGNDCSTNAAERLAALLNACDASVSIISEIFICHTQ